MSDFNDSHIRYRSQLRPFLEMLMHKRSELKRDDWICMVRKIEQNIINTPDQYLTDYKNDGNLTIAIQQVFNEFFIELGIAARMNLYK